MIKVVKFGGSSLADAKQFEKVKQIVSADDARRFVVVSAAGRRHKENNGFIVFMPCPSKVQCKLRFDLSND